MSLFTKNEIKLQVVKMGLRTLVRLNMEHIYYDTPIELTFNYHTSRNRLQSGRPIPGRGKLFDSLEQHSPEMIVVNGPWSLLNTFSLYGNLWHFRRGSVSF